MKNKRIATLVYAALTFIVVLCLFPKFSYNDPDTFWHIELGKYMLQNGTVLHHAINTFYNDQLPYVPHEFGFQIIIALLYKAFGWPGTYILTALCLLLLTLGLYRLTRVSRKEMGLEQHHSVMYLFVLAVTCCIYFYYFTARPQMISAFLIVWFFVYLREFRMQQSSKYAILMALISMGVANIHAGVWPVIAVFTAMAIIEAWAEKRLGKRNIIAFAFVYIAGLINVGGLKSIFYILTVTKNNFNMRIDEWQPINFGEWINLPRTVLLLLFMCIIPFVLHKKLFRFMFMLGIVYLGIASYKQNLFMWLFIPYFAATVVDLVPYTNKIRIQLSTKSIAIFLAAALSVNLIFVSVYPVQTNKHDYPVEEMTYILKQKPDGVRPKVLAPYGSSGYVNFRGGDILCDGRQDPFVTDESKGVFGWTAFERSMNGFSDYLTDIVAYDKPEYVITSNKFYGRPFNKMIEKYGQPVFKGTYGNVFLIK
ncbi:hypothetical protein [Cohnella abietis]|uniref:Glycosyltransferase RgtA/B/C/D-like domain-containing protein n=1 Tax=Cohnella abietis TaxID=2507935 RepID=A0A3T1D331_9BACL|nr:hypothetical protein [Cohnella abietis]BBI32415.1 hypothetical protein KCTCHS21_18140 [Cohnella abietis]